MKNIEIKLFATLSAYGKSSCLDKHGMMKIKDKTTIEDVLIELKVPLESVKLIFLNGRHAPKERTLQDGDRVGIFPPIGGG